MLSSWKSPLEVALAAREADGAAALEEVRLDARAAQAGRGGPLRVQPGTVGAAAVLSVPLDPAPMPTFAPPPREVAAAKYDLNYIGLDGSIGCMVNGVCGGRPAPPCTALQGAALEARRRLHIAPKTTSAQHT